MEVHIASNRIEYRFNIKGKYTIINGDSGTGKTTFYELVRALNRGLKLYNSTQIKIIAVPEEFEFFDIDKFNNSILVIDENCTLFKRKDFAKILQKSNNYFIIMSRTRKLNSLPISVESMYRIKTSGKTNTLEELYKRQEIKNIDNLDLIITEDEGSGYKFIKELLSAFDIQNIDIITSHGAASIAYKSIEESIKLRNKKNIALIFDYSAFGEYINDLYETIRQYSTKCKFYLLDWQSFENYILNSKLYNANINLEDTKCNYNSLEIYSEQLIKKYVADYRKDNLSKCLRRDRCIECKKNCKYKTGHSYTELIYDKIAILYDYICKYNRIKLDISYRIFNNHNKALKSINTRIVRISNTNINTGECLIERNNKTYKIIDIVILVMTNKICLSNPSMLKNWHGWTN